MKRLAKVLFKKYWYALVEVLRENDQKREQCIIEADKLNKFKVEEFLNNPQSLKFVKLRVKSAHNQIDDGDTEEAEKYCCVLKVRGRIFEYIFYI